MLEAYQLTPSLNLPIQARPERLLRSKQEPIRLLYPQFVTAHLPADISLAVVEIHEVTEEWCRQGRNIVEILNITGRLLERTPPLGWLERNTYGTYITLDKTSRGFQQSDQNFRVTHTLSSEHIISGIPKRDSRALFVTQGTTQEKLKLIGIGILEANEEPTKLISHLEAQFNPLTFDEIYTLQQTPEL